MLQRKERIDYKNFNNNQEKGNKNKDIFVTFVVVLIIIGSLFAIQISQAVTITHLSYKTEELETRLNSLKEKNKKLEIEVTKKISLRKIEKIAKNDLGMVEAKEVKYVAINNQEDNIQKNETQNKNMNFVQGIHNLIKKLDTVNASSP
ncbi:MAG TPA: septum formation initiator family protein [Halanaerobiales bacterium]|nr:septum formation initiator family protein [Halanaerobiales bacterium]